MKRFRAALGPSSLVVSAVNGMPWGKMRGAHGFFAFFEGFVILNSCPFLCFDIFRISLTPHDRCPGCEALRQQLEDCIDRARREWISFSQENPGSNRVPLEPVFPGITLGDAEGAFSFIPSREHSCGLGNYVSMPRILYHPLHVVRADEDDPVNLLLVFHIMMPGEMIYRWSTARDFVASFPLHGRLRRYWGPGLRVEGTMLLNCYTWGQAVHLFVQQFAQTSSILTGA